MVNVSRLEFDVNDGAEDELSDDENEGSLKKECGKKENRESRFSFGVV